MFAFIQVIERVEREGSLFWCRLHYFVQLTRGNMNFNWVTFWDSQQTNLRRTNGLWNSVLRVPHVTCLIHVKGFSLKGDPKTGFLLKKLNIV